MTADEAPSVALAWEQQAAIIGGYRWFEHRLFEITGAWSTTSNEPIVALHFADASIRHGWHSGLWEEHLPFRDGVDRLALSAPHGSLMGSLMDQLIVEFSTGEPSSETDVQRLAALSLVVDARLCDSYRTHRARAAEIAERPAIETLEVVTPRTEAERTAGLAVLASLYEEIGTASHVSELEALVARLSQHDGLFAWPESSLR
jgi:hypothetical protein